MVRIAPSIVLLLGALTLPVGPATAQNVAHRHKIVRSFYPLERPPLTVNRRSFLDPGPVVPVGSLSNYVTANTIFNRTPDQVFNRSHFGNELLPAPLEVPGRPSPILEFSTPAYY
jgi:hypothetical protein